MKLNWEEIDGWFYHKPFYDWLLERLKPKASVAEIGVLCGKSIVYLAQESKRRGLKLNLFGVDTFKVCDEYKPWLHRYSDKEDFYGLYRENLRRAEVTREIVTYRMASIDAAKLFDDHSEDCVFIDAGHDEESVTADIQAWRPKVKPGGILSGDDYTFGWPGVMAAVDRLVPDRKLMGQTWWIEL